jgi:hypothetical protein
MKGHEILVEYKVLKKGLKKGKGDREEREMEGKNS